MRVLSDDDVADVLELPALLDAVGDAFRKQGDGAVERPERPHFPVGAGLGDDRRGPGDPPAPDPMGEGLAMPAYLHGSPYFVTKLVGVHPGNPDRGLATVNAAVVLQAAETGVPVCLAAGNRITNARTGCVGGLAARELSAPPVDLGVIGAGAQARWQTRAIDAATDLGRVRIHSPSDSRLACAADLRAEGIDAEAVASPAAAVRDASVVVTATTASEPVFDGDDLATGALVIAVGAYDESMHELDGRTVERAARLFGDVPAEAAATGDFPDRGPDSLTPFSSVLAGTAGRDSPEDVIVLKSVGTAVLDAAAAELVYDRARTADAGTVLDL